MSTETTTEENPFKPYTEIPSVLPEWVWVIARLVTFAISVSVIWMIYAYPDTGVKIFWKIFIPSCPLLFAIIPGLWRQVCPMAFLNQIPVQLGFSAGKTLPISLKESSYLYATVLFIGLVGIKHLATYTESTPLIIMLIGALITAFVGGIIFKGRSGWCGTFCPLGPLQKVYGHAPPIVIKNGFCKPSCVGCQKNCYDFSPRDAFYKDLYDSNPWYAGHRRFFIAILPGLVLSFWTYDVTKPFNAVEYTLEMAFWLVASAGTYFILTTVSTMSVYRVSALFGAAALYLYYWFAASHIVTATNELTGITVPDWTIFALQVAVIAVTARNLVAGFVTENDFHRLRSGPGTPAVGVKLDALKEGIGDVREGVVKEMASGKMFAADPNKSILDQFEHAGIQIDYGCRTGMCGADPIVVEEGHEHLNEISADEMSTLRRMGLDGRGVRMACVCRANSGPVTINLDADPHAQPVLEETGPKEDLAELAGISKVVIVGNGVAGITAADLLRQESPSCEIHVISRENHHFYNRMAIGRAIYGRAAMDGLYLMPPSWHEDKNVNVWLNTQAREINREAKEIRLATGDILNYDKLVLAMGARAFIPPVPGSDLRGCFALREADDAMDVRKWCQDEDVTDACVIGGGVLGIEAADALRQLGIRTTIVQRSDRLMDRNLDEKGSLVLQEFLTGLGFDIKTNANLAEITGNDHVSEVVLDDGQKIPAQICIFCAGIRANIKLAERADLETNRGILVSNTMQTSDPNIYAIGDVAEFADEISGLWTLGTKHAQLATAHMLEKDATYSPPRPIVQLKMDGIDVVAFGATQAQTAAQEEIFNANEGELIRRKVVVENGQIVGAVFVGPPGTGHNMASVIQENPDITPLLNDLRQGSWGKLTGATDDLEPTPRQIALSQDEDKVMSEQDGKSHEDATDHPMRRKLTTILYADAVEYSRLMADDEEDTVRTLRAYRKVWDDQLERHHGRLVDTAGDAIVVEFASAVEAVRCAVAVQEDLAVRNSELTDDRKMLFRIGINVGDVIVDDDKLIGDGVNVAARLEGIADPGGICISGSTHEQVRRKLSVGFDSMGAKKVKNIPEPVPTYRVIAGTIPFGDTKENEERKKVRFPGLTMLASAAIVLIAVGGLLAYYMKWVVVDTDPSAKKFSNKPTAEGTKVAGKPKVETRTETTETQKEAVKVTPRASSETPQTSEKTTKPQQAQTEATETKPAETKPAETKPAETKPAKTEVAEKPAKPATTTENKTETKTETAAQEQRQQQVAKKTEPATTTPAQQQQTQSKPETTAPANQETATQPAQSEQSTEQQVARTEPAQTVSLKTTELQQVMPGMTISGPDGLRGLPFRVQVEQGGQAIAEVNQTVDGGDGHFTDTGRWWAAQDQVCVQFNLFFGGRPVCMNVTRTGQKYTAMYVGTERPMEWKLEKTK